MKYYKVVDGLTMTDLDPELHELELYDGSVLGLEYQNNILCRSDGMPMFVYDESLNLKPLLDHPSPGERAHGFNIIIEIRERLQL
jgi:hypothetical protein